MKTQRSQKYINKINKLKKKRVKRQVTQWRKCLQYLQYNSGLVSRVYEKYTSQLKKNTGNPILKQMGKRPEKAFMK